MENRGEVATIMTKPEVEAQLQKANITCHDITPTFSPTSWLIRPVRLSFDEQTVTGRLWDVGFILSEWIDGGRELLIIERKATDVNPKND